LRRAAIGLWLVGVGAACGPLSLDLGGEPVPVPTETGGLPSVEPLGGQGGSGNASDSLQGGTGGNSAWTGGSTGSGGSAGAADSCPLDVASGADCSSYPAEANCKLGDTYYHCEQGLLWMVLERYQVIDPARLDCPLGVADAASCDGYSPGAHCCTTESECYTCNGRYWEQVEG
jgi:hypothetical protein